MDLDSYKPLDSCQITGLQYIMAGVFGLKTFGHFLEVGAYDGKTYSNTWQLAELGGWTGVYVEPVPHLYNACLLNHALHTNVDVVNAFVTSDDDGYADIYTSDYINMYTGDKDFMKEFMPDNAQLVATVKKTTVDKLLSEYEFPSNFDLLVIDAEGHELDVLAGSMILERWMPQMVIIESHEFATDKRLRVHTRAINEYFDRVYYNRIYADTINSIYIPCCLAAS